MQLPSADMAHCAACDPSNTDRTKVHVCPRLANPDVKTNLVAATEPGARRDRWQDAVNAEVNFRYDVVGANFLGGGFGRVFVVECCGGSGQHDLACAVHCRICRDAGEERDPVLILPGSGSSIMRKKTNNELLWAIKDHCQKSYPSTLLHLRRHAALANEQVRDVVRRKISEWRGTEPEVPVLGMAESSVVASPAFSVRGLLAQVRDAGGAGVIARAVRDGYQDVAISCPQPSFATTKPFRILTLGCGVEVWRARVGSRHESELLLVGQRVGAVLVEASYVCAVKCGSDAGHHQTLPLYACDSSQRLQRLARIVAGPPPGSGFDLVAVTRSRNLLRLGDYGWARGRYETPKAPWPDHAREHVNSALAAFDEVIASSSVSEPDKALARDARSDLLSRGFGRLRLPEFVAEFRKRAAHAPAPSAAPALPPLPVASPAPAAAREGLSIDGGGGETARVADPLPPI